jgi:hypothetical protein
VPQTKMLRAIELLGTGVAPAVNKQLKAAVARA